MPPATPRPHTFGDSQEVEKLGDHVIMDAPTLLAQQDGDIAATLEEVSRLGGLIRQLKQNRARLLRRVNNVQAATRRLPAEVLSTIFQFARPPIDFGARSTPSELPEDRYSRRETYREEDDFQLVLGAVSYHWRQVAWATPQLWTTISVEVYETTRKNIVSLLDLYFENSRSFRMTLELDFRAQLVSMLNPIEEGQDESVLLIESVKTSVLSNATKIRNFIITGLPMSWISLIDKSFSQCESLTLYWPSSYARERHTGSGSLDLTELTGLYRLRLKDLIIPFILPCQTITTLQLHGVTVKQCVESLIKCPNLVKFENLGFGKDAFQNSSPSPNQPIVLEHLESLTWRTHEDPWSSAFLCHIRFTKLRVLRLSFHPHDDPLSETFHDDLAAFFSDIPETLQVLELANICLPYQLMKAALSSVPHLTELILDKCDLMTCSLAISMIGRPVGGLVEDTETRMAVVDPDKLGGVKVIPRLRKLMILANYGNPLPKLIVDMLEALQGARVMREHFHFELSRVYRSYLFEVGTWGLELLVRLARLAESGFPFEIIIDSRPLSLDYMSRFVMSFLHCRARAPTD